MTRVTAPREIAKIARALGSTVAAPRPSRLPSNASQTAASQARRELEQDVPASEKRTITTSHRPATLTPTPNPNRVIPLMQGFHTTPHARLRAEPSSSESSFTPIDFAVLPGANLLFGAGGALESYNPVLPTLARVPLLPDNFAPSRSADVGHLPEVPDAPLAAPEIVVMAADPAAVSAVSPLTEVEGMGPDGVELKFVHDAGSGSGSGSAAGRQRSEFAGGMLRGF